MKTVMLSFACAIIVGAAVLAAMVVDQPHAQSPQPDPWQSDGMRVLGTLNTPNGEHVTAVYVPAWPLSTMCLIVSSPTGMAVRCDTDAPADGR